MENQPLKFENKLGLTAVVLVAMLFVALFFFKTGCNNTVVITTDTKYDSLQNIISDLQIKEMAYIESIDSIGQVADSLRDTKPKITINC